MDKLSKLEDAVLIAIASQTIAEASALNAQRSAATVVCRNNTGAGFYTILKVDTSCPRIATASPIGDITAAVRGLKHGMGFLLWLKNGRMEKLEAYSFDENTSNIDLNTFDFELGPI